MVAIFRAVGVLYPRRQTRSLVVEEQATKLYCRFSISIGSRQDTHIVTLDDRHIHPPVPGRHAHLATQFVDAIDGASTVAAGNDYLSVDCRNDELLTLPYQVSQFSALHPLVYLLAVAHSSNEDGGLFALCRNKSHHPQEVFLQIGGSHLNSLGLLGTKANRRAL